MASKFMSITIRLVLITPLIGVWLMADQERSYACQCIWASPSRGLVEADAVFMGRVVNVGVSEAVKYDPWIAEFDVGTVWKGHVCQTTYVYTAGPGSPCEGVVSFAEGAVYIVYAGYTDEGLWPMFCESKLPEAIDDLAELGEGKTPAKGTDTPPPGMRMTGGGCGTSPHTIDLSFLGLLSGLAWFGLRRRKL